MVNSHKPVGRNDPCPCGSGKKFKKCCLHLNSPSQPPPGLAEVDLLSRAAARFLPKQTEETIQTYDPFTEPDPEQWLALDEQHQVDLVVAYHRRAGIRFAREKVHAIAHATVENQIALADLPVRRVSQRLMSEGLDRHEAIHAISSVLMGHINDLLKESTSAGNGAAPASGRDPNEEYFAQLDVLTADEWLRSG
jgi:hypothetical protein